MNASSSGSLTVSDTPKTAEEFFEADAAKQGLTLAEYYKKYGIVGRAQMRQIRRRERPLKERE